MRTSSALVAIMLVTIPTMASAQETAPPEPSQPAPPAEPSAPVEPREPGGVGQACRARWQCQPSYRCLRNVCVERATFAQDRAETLPAADTFLASRFYLGASFGTPLPGIWLGNAGVGVQGSVRFGMVINHFQLQMDISPAATAIDTRRPIAMFEAAATAGYLIPLNDVMSWVFRAGGGGGFTFNSGSGDPAGGAVGFTEIRLDFVGVAIQTSDHLFVEFNAPSYRLLFPSSAKGGLSMMFVTSVAVNYLF